MVAAVQEVHELRRSHIFTNSLALECGVAQLYLLERGQTISWNLKKAIAGVGTWPRWQPIRCPWNGSFSGWYVLDFDTKGRNCTASHLTCSLHFLCLQPLPNIPWYHLIVEIGLAVWIIKLLFFSKSYQPRRAEEDRLTVEVYCLGQRIRLFEATHRDMRKKEIL